jgi:CheY-like chemotaxis protein
MESNLPVGVLPPWHRERIVRELPMLRRFAHAFAGGPLAGDARLACYLGAGQLPCADLDDRAVRVALVRGFLSFDRARGSIDLLEPGLGEEAVRAALLRLEGDERAAVLLHDMCDVAYEDVAPMLGITALQAAQHVRSGRAALARQCGARVMVIEDEPLIALHIQQIVSDMGHVVCATAHRESEVADLAERTQPTLILADLNLAEGGSGAAAVRDVLQRMETQVMYVTAYPERLVGRLDVDPAMVLAKPFESSALRFAVDRALARVGIR